MKTSNTLSPSVLRALRALDTCTVSNAIESFEVRLRNEGFVHGALRCLSSPKLEPMVGYAVTGRIRTSSAPITGRCYYNRMDWWEYVSKMPSPRVIVMDDSDHQPGVGAFFGEIHAHISKALGCVGYVTNGAVRDLPAVAAAKFHLFASSVSVSHAYAHVVEFGEPVEIGNLKITPGDLLHGDQHGVLQIPLEIAADLPRAAAELREHEQQLIQFCQSQDFSLQTLALRCA